MKVESFATNDKEEMYEEELELTKTSITIGSKDKPKMKFGKDRKVDLVGY